VGTLPGNCEFGKLRIGWKHNGRVQFNGIVVKIGYGLNWLRLVFVCRLRY
jgi:hypothetical protein